MDGCTVSWEGDYQGTYYIPCDRAEFLNDELINTGGSSFNAYSNVYQGNNNAYITFPVNGYPYYRDNNSYNYHYITNVSNVTFNAKSYFYKEFDLAVLITLGIIAVVQLLKMWRA